MVKFSLREKIIKETLFSVANFYLNSGKFEINNHQALEGLNSGGYVLANHISNLDLLYVGYSVMSGVKNAENVFAIGKKGLKSKFLLGKSPHVLPVIRGKDKKKGLKSGIYKSVEHANLEALAFNGETMSYAEKLVDLGNVLTLFPQGRRTFDSSLPVNFREANIKSWFSNPSKPVVLINVDYNSCGGDKKIITFSDPHLFKDSIEIVEYSKDFYSSFRWSVLYKLRNFSPKT